VQIDCGIISPKITINTVDSNIAIEGENIQCKKIGKVL